MTDTKRVKLHRRGVSLDGRGATLLTLRSSSPERFTTRFIDGAWHILTDPAGVELLGQLCWAMAFQQRPATFVLIDLPFLTPNASDSEPSSPIAIVNSDLEPPTDAALADLAAMLPLETPSDGTVRLMTRGLDHAGDADVDSTFRAEAWINRIGGIVVFAAPPEALKLWALDLVGRLPA